MACQPGRGVAFGPSWAVVCGVYTEPTTESTIGPAAHSALHPPCRRPWDPLQPPTEARRGVHNGA
eukprot:2026575-Lingulodinium_polyedra.AAC.1